MDHSNYIDTTTTQQFLESQTNLDLANIAESNGV